MRARRLQESCGFGEFPEVVGVPPVIIHDRDRSTPEGSVPDAYRGAPGPTGNWANRRTCDQTMAQLTRLRVASHWPGNSGRSQFPDGWLLQRGPCHHSRPTKRPTDRARSAHVLPGPQNAQITISGNSRATVASPALTRSPSEREGRLSTPSGALDGRVPDDFSTRQVRLTAHAPFLLLRA